MASKKKKSRKSSRSSGVEWPPAEWPEEDRQAWIANAQAYFNAWFEWGRSYQPGDPIDFEWVSPSHPDKPAEIIPFPRSRND